MLVRPPTIEMIAAEGGHGGVAGSPPARVRGHGRAYRFRPDRIVANRSRRDRGEVPRVLHRDRRVRGVGTRTVLPITGIFREGPLRAGSVRSRGECPEDPAVSGSRGETGGEPGRIGTGTSLRLPLPGHRTDPMFHMEHSPGGIPDPFATRRRGVA